MDFVRYFWAAYNYAYQTYDTNLLSTASSSNCAYCRSTVDDVKNIAAAGTVVEGYQVKVDHVSGPPDSAVIKTGTLVLASCSQASGVSHHADGKSVPLKGFGSTGFSFALRWTDSRWLVEAISYKRR